MMRAINHIIILSLSVFIAACSTTSAIPDGEQLYAGLKKIEYAEHEGGQHFIDTQTEVEAALSAAPNGAFFGSSYYRTPLPWRLWLWNATYGKTSGIARWLNKTFTSYPTLMSDVNPAVRAQVAQMTLANNGYFRGTVGYEELTMKNPKEGKIAYTVTPNELFTLDSIAYTKFPAPMDTLIRQTLSGTYLHKGDGFSTENLELERQRIASVFRNNGYYYYQSGYASYLADTIATPERVDLRLQLADSLDSRITRRWYIGKMDLHLYRKGITAATDSFKYRNLTIHYDGKKPLMRPRVILSNLRLYSRMMYSYDAYQESISRLSGNQNFSSIDFAFTPRDTTALCDTLDMAVYCVFNKPYDVSVEGKFTGKTSSRVGPGLELTIARRNLLRYGEKISLDVYGSIEWQIGGGGTNGSRGVNSYEYGADLSLELPRLAVPFKVNRRWYATPSTTVKLSTDFINRGDYFSRNIISAELTYSMQTNAVSRHSFSPLIIEYDYMNRTTETFEALLEENPYLRVAMRDRFIPKMRYSYTYTSPAAYRSPITWNITLSEASNIISLFYMMAGKGWGEKDKNLIKNPYAQFIKAETDFSKSWRISEGSSIVGHVSAGIIYSYGNSSDAPYSEQFYVGGANSVRAFTVRAIGPGRYHTSERGLSYASQTGDIKFTANIEYRPRLFGNLYGAVFLDTGNVWKLHEDERGSLTTLSGKRLMKDMALGTGIGIRYDLDFFVIRLDWGVGLHIPYDTGHSGYFNIGRLKDCNSLHLAIGYPF